jgi:hypothetical protein
MKFKHSFHIFVDNFSTAYKLLLYRVVITVVFTCIYACVIYPFIARITGAEQFKQLYDSFKAVTTSLVNLDLTEITETLRPFRTALVNFIDFLSTKVSDLVLVIVIIAVVYLIQKFLLGLGNYTIAALLNDKMSFQLDSPFFGTLIKNLGKASLYNVIYVPLSFLYDAIVVVIVYLIFFKALSFIPLVFEIFLFTTVIISLTSLKMTFTTDWLPSLICGKTNNRTAMAYAFSRKNKHTTKTFSNFLVLTLIILASNVIAIFFTFGAGFLLTVPSSYILLISFELINYCDDNNMRYFIDKETIVKPETEKKITREEFFKGE